MTLIELIKTGFQSKNGIYYLEEPAGNFEEIYIKVRNSEGRIYSDDELSKLPDIESAHKYYNEWQIRKHSMEKLVSYLNTNNLNKTILEIGCGNGWLSANLARSKNFDIIGLDINIAELEQAARVFSAKENLLFVYGNIFNVMLTFDFIILSSSIGYFKNLPKLVTFLLERLNKSGEIHIIDSPFYEDIAPARTRSKEYFTMLGYPEMDEKYFHHSLNELSKFNYHILYNPDSLINKIERKVMTTLSPFHWVKIVKL